MIYILSRFELRRSELWSIASETGIKSGPDGPLGRLVCRLYFVLAVARNKHHLFFLSGSEKVKYKLSKITQSRFLMLKDMHHQ